MRSSLIIFGLLLVAFVVWVAFFKEAYISDGWPQITVHVTRDADTVPLRAVRGRMFGRRQDAEWVLGRIPNAHKSLDRWSREADPFTGQPLNVVVAVSTRETLIWVEVGRYQERYLLVIGDLQDGRQVGTVVEIPDIRVSGEIHVVLP